MLFTSLIFYVPCGSSVCCAATTTAQAPKDSPCTLPKPDQAEALGTLSGKKLTGTCETAHSGNRGIIRSYPTPSLQSPSRFASLRPSPSPSIRAAILSTPVSGSFGGWTGDVNASGQVCLAVYGLNGDYNIFYSVVASKADAGEPTFAGIAKDVGQERLVAVFFSPPGTDGLWEDLTHAPLSPNQSRKSLGVAPASPST
ncbi:unnamed protein product [Closterium sp. NIES-53]